RWLTLPDVLGVEGERSDLGRVLATNELRGASTRFESEWVGAFDERRSDLARAAQLACDFALLGPVLPDSRWSDRPALGWMGFAQLATASPVPIFAFGGLAPDDLQRAREHGAHGIARSLSAS